MSPLNCARLVLLKCNALWYPEKGGLNDNNLVERQWRTALKVKPGVFAVLEQAVEPMAVRILNNEPGALRMIGAADAFLHLECISNEAAWRFLRLMAYGPSPAESTHGSMCVWPPTCESDINLLWANLSANAERDDDFERQSTQRVVDLANSERSLLCLIGFKVHGAPPVLWKEKPTKKRR